MISAPICPARSSATSDLPEAVGPAMKIISGGDLRGGARRLLSDPRQLPKQNESRRQNGDPHQLSGRKDAAMNVRRGIVAAKALDHGPNDGVADQVSGEDL